MRITPFGAAGGEVTGSSYLVQTSRASLLVDHGIFQGSEGAETKNRALPAFDVRSLNAVLLTHAHLDHSGRLPLLGKAGYSGPIHATPASVEMASLILHDSAKIQASDNERINRKRQRAGEPPVEPLYTVQDVENTMARFQPATYGTPFEVAPGITAKYVEAGHMLGSSSIQLKVQEDERTQTVVFSGDLGPKGIPILRDSEPFNTADLVVVESTYGDHDHKPFGETVEEFFSIVSEVVQQKGKILVPTFAVGRAQLLGYLLAWAFRTKRIPDFPIYLDSPMAIQATQIYRQHPELFDDDLVALIKEHSIFDDLRQLHMSVTAQDSQKLNDVTGPCMILAGAGMCNAGRILHHLKQNLWKPETHVLIVGYQGQGTLGRMLVEGVKQVKIFGEKIAVRARVHTLGGFSAHAGQTDLLNWLESMMKSRPRVVLTHGEDRARRALARQIKTRFGVAAEQPSLGEEIAL